MVTGVHKLTNQLKKRKNWLPNGGELLAGNDDLVITLWIVNTHLPVDDQVTSLHCLVQFNN